MSKSKGKNAQITTGPASAEHVRAVQELRRSGAAGTHGDRRTKRNRTRGAQRRNSIRESE